MNSGPAGGGFARDVLKLMSGTTAVQILSLLVTPWITRLYPPEAFGLLALFLSVSALPGVMACLRYDAAIPLTVHARDASALLRVSLLLSAATALLCFFAFRLLGAPLADWLRADSLLPLLPRTAWMAGLIGAVSALTFWNSRRRQFGRIAFASLAGALCTAGLKIGLGLRGDIVAASLIHATLAGQALNALLLTRGLWSDAETTPPEPGNWRRQMVRYRKFPLVDLWGALLNIASWQIPPLLFAAFFNAASVGLYALAFRFIQLPMSLIGAAISQVFYPRLAAVRAAGAPLGPHAEGLFHRLTVLGLFPALLCAAAGPGLFGWVFGEAWREAGQYARILSPWVWVWFISSPLSVLFNTLERQGRLLGFQMLIFGSRLLAIFLGSRLGDMRLALTLFSLSGALVYGALCVDALRLAGARTGNCLRGLGPAFAAATLLGLPVYALQRAEVPGLWLTAAAGAASVVYFLCAFWLDVELRTLVRGWKNRMQEPTP